MRTTLRLQDMATAVGGHGRLGADHEGGTGSGVGRLAPVPANGVHNIMSGLSFPVIVTNFGTREVVLRQRANVGYVELLTTGVVQVPRAAPNGASAVLAVMTQSSMSRVVGAVSDTRVAPGPGRGPGAAVPAGGGPATPERPRDPGERGPSPGAPQPVAPVHVKDVDLPDANPALHTRIRRMLG